MDALPLSDEELVRRVRAGDQTAAGTLYERYADRLRALARRRLLGRVRRKVGESDLVQDVYMAAFAALERFEDQGPGSFRRWLEGILDHKAKDAVKRFVGVARRSVKHEDSLPAGAVPPQVAHRDPSPSVRVAGLEERDLLRQAIAGADGDDRTILRLVHEQGLDFAEAGRAMGRSAEAARKLYGRVVLRLARERKRQE